MKIRASVEVEYFLAERQLRRLRLCRMQCGSRGRRRRQGRPRRLCRRRLGSSHANIAAVMGVDPGTAEPLKSLNTVQRRRPRRRQVHLQRCHDLLGMTALYGGKRVCSIGCLGMGDCVRSCMFDAIYMAPKAFGHRRIQMRGVRGLCHRLPERPAFRKNHVPAATGLQRGGPCTGSLPADLPRGNRHPKYIRLIKEGDYEGAVNTIRERNPLLLSCGRVCPHPCENYCRRGLEDEPVSINQLKRFVATTK